MRQVDSRSFSKVWNVELYSFCSQPSKFLPCSKNVCVEYWYQDIISPGLSSSILFVARNTSFDKTIGFCKLLFACKIHIIFSDFIFCIYWIQLAPLIYCLYASIKRVFIFTSISATYPISLVFNEYYSTLKSQLDDAHFLFHNKYFMHFMYW